jgi:hypothetical protein
MRALRAASMLDPDPPTRIQHQFRNPRPPITRRSFVHAPSNHWIKHLEMISIPNDPIRTAPAMSRYSMAQYYQKYGQDTTDIADRIKE